MHRSPWITDVEGTPAPPRDVARGLIAFVSLTVDGVLRVDGLTLRRARDGRHSVSLPRRRGHPIVRPLTADGTRELERQVLVHLGLEAAS